LRPHSPDDKLAACSARARAKSTAARVAPPLFVTLRLINPRTCRALGQLARREPPALPWLTWQVQLCMGAPCLSVVAIRRFAARRCAAFSRPRPIADAPVAHGLGVCVVCRFIGSAQGTRRAQQPAQAQTAGSAPAQAVMQGPNGYGPSTNDTEGDSVPVSGSASAHTSA
jgi:hypothetical protein